MSTKSGTFKRIVEIELECEYDASSYVDETGHTQWVLDNLTIYLQNGTACETFDDCLTPMQNRDLAECAIAECESI